jgi:hypothetical protein
MSEPILLVRTNARGLLTLTMYGSKDNASMPFLTRVRRLPSPILRDS